MLQVLLLSGDGFNEFALPCAVTTPACTGREGPTGLVTLLPAYQQLQCCRACFELKTREGEWALASPPQAPRSEVPVPAWDVDRPLTLDEAEQRLADAATWFASARQSEETRLSFGFMGDSLAVAFHGWLDERLLKHALTLVASEGIAPHVWRFRLSGEAEGTNGTRAWNIEPLGRGAVFSQLEVLDIEGSQPGDFFRTIVASGFDEEGMIARALARMPRLRRLSVPSAPNEEFFEGPPHPLRELVLQSGYDTQDFIARLARTRRFPELEALDFTDYAETYMDDYAQRRTPPEAFEALLASPFLPALRQVVLRGTVLDKVDARRLKDTLLGRRLSQFDVMPLEPGGEG